MTLPILSIRYSEQIMPATCYVNIWGTKGCQIESKHWKLHTIYVVLAGNI